MATITVQALLIPLLLVLLSSCLLASSSSGSHWQKQHCIQECSVISEHQQWTECMHHCIDRSSKAEAGREQQKQQHEEEAEGGGRRERNPYYFDQRRYAHWIRTEHGQFKVLERFAERSKLLTSIENYRLAVLEAEPETFIMPSHWDAEAVLYVMEGRGMITLLHDENRESHNIRRGDIMRVPAGAIVYAINKARNEKLRVAMLLCPISTPGNIEEFFGAAGRNPETFYTSFSNEVLEAAFNTPMDKLERLFGRQRKGEIIKIDEEQIKALSQSTTRVGGRGAWPFAHSNEPYNLLEKKPSRSNEHGELYQASGNDYEQLQKLDVDVSVANISERSMMAPHFNSRSTVLAMVVKGSGYFEMVCPQRSRERPRGEEERESSRGRQRIRYRTVRSQVPQGSVFVIPAGHPVAAVAAGSENLQVLCFGIRAANNRRYYLAGRNNALNRLEREAKELAFGARAEEVEEVLNAQRESVFVPGPERRRREEERGRKHSLESLFSFEGF